MGGACYYSGIALRDSKLNDSGFSDGSPLSQSRRSPAEAAQFTLNCIRDAILTTDISGKVTYLNPTAERMTGWSLEEASGRAVGEVLKIIDGTTREPFRNPVELPRSEDTVVGLAANCVLIRRDGLETVVEDSAAPIHDQEGRVIGAVIVFHALTEARATALRMSHLAQYDFLTGLANRMLLKDRLTHALALAARYGRQLAVLFVDLDHFKQVNDSAGHALGDQMLRSIAERLLACVRSSDTVSRQGGDEFVILLSEIDHITNVMPIAKKILDVVAAPLISRLTFFISLLALVSACIHGTVRMRKR
jgi:diguanylate cyclase (GGDEF)-like protein/PAS domain S-box-containing protein